VPWEVVAEEHSVARPSRPQAMLVVQPVQVSLQVAQASILTEEAMEAGYS